MSLELADEGDFTGCRSKNSHVVVLGMLIFCQGCQAGFEDFFLPPKLIKDAAEKHTSLFESLTMSGKWSKRLIHLHFAASPHSFVPELLCE
jgi:hypothetical protein